MRECVRPEDGECLEGFPVEQGVRQGYLLTPLLFNIVFKVIIQLALMPLGANVDSVV